jgi:hypothetical protein
MVAPMLLREANSSSSAAAITWLEKVLATDSGDGVAVQTLWGVHTTERVALLGDVELLPFEQLPDSRQKEQLARPDWPGDNRLMMPMYTWHRPSAALVVRLTIRPFVLSPEAARQISIDQVTEVARRCDDIRLCLALSGPAAVVSGPAWFQYLDEDLERAVVGFGTTASHQEVVPTHCPPSPDFDIRQATDVVGQFEALRPELRNRVRVAMERLHLSLMRRSSADKALELAIALEALLVDAPGEHTFKIGLRAALLTAEAGDMKGRSRNRSIVGAAYGLRSAVVHSGRAPEHCTPRGLGKMLSTDVTSEAVSITAAVIRRIVTDGQLPEWDLLEMSR